MGGKYVIHIISFYKTSAFETALLHNLRTSKSAGVLCGVREDVRMIIYEWEGV
jgi:hypothetical protein